jgi:hypothetical protein
MEVRIVVALRDPRRLQTYAIAEYVVNIAYQPDLTRYGLSLYDSIAPGQTALSLKYYSNHDMRFTSALALPSGYIASAMALYVKPLNLRRNSVIALDRWLNMRRLLQAPTRPKYRQASAQMMTHDRALE